MWLLFGLASCLAGGVIASILFAAAHPGVKGPSITEGELFTAFFVGNVLGAVAAYLVWRWRARAR